MGTEDSPEDSSSSAPASPSQLTEAGAREVSAGWLCPIRPSSLSITSRVGSCLHRFFCSCARLLFRRTAACLDCSQPCDCMLHTGTQGSSTEEHRHIPAARGQRSGARERAQSRSPQWGRDLRSWLVDTTDYEHARGRRRTAPPSRVHAARDDAAARPSDSSSQFAPTPSAALEQTLPRQREQSRSLCQGYGLRSRFMENTDCHRSARRTRRWRAGPPHRDQAPEDDAAAGLANASSGWAPIPRAAREQTLLRQRQRSRSPWQSCDLRSQFMDTTDYDSSAGRRRRRRKRRRRRVLVP